MIMRDWAKRPGVGGFPDAFTSIDLGSRFKSFDPVKSKDHLNTYQTIKHVVGDDNGYKVYSDSWTAIKSAVTALGLSHEFCEPGTSETNAIIERCNGDFRAGIRTYLYEAGLPQCFWSYAGPCYAMHETLPFTEKEKIKD